MYYFLCLGKNLKECNFRLALAEHYLMGFDCAIPTDQVGVADSFAIPKAVEIGFILVAKVPISEIH